jgi:3'(2'), 5'-bisphosphate nucleotidase
MLFSSDHDVAHSIAREAGELLLELRAGEPEGRALGDAGDRSAHTLILDRLRDLRPDDVVRSEEGARRDTSDERRVWIVDPLDGTREYAEGRHDWAVHVALWEDGALGAGSVALPALGETLSTATPPKLAPRQPGPIRVVVSRSRPPQIAEEVARALDGNLVPMGSAGAKTTAVVRGEADAYVHAGGQYEWDSAAPVAVAAAAGVHVSRLDGSPLAYNRADPWLPDIVVCRPELAADVLRVTAAAA